MNKIQIRQLFTLFVRPLVYLAVRERVYHEEHKVIHEVHYVVPLMKPLVSLVVRERVYHEEHKVIHEVHYVVPLMKPLVSLVVKGC